MARTRTTLPRKTTLAATTALVPAAARAPEVLTDVETELNVQAVEAFAQRLGGRGVLTAVLGVAEGDPAVEKVLSYLLDPRYDAWPLRKICRLAGLTIVDLFTAYKRAALTAAHIESTHLIAKALPPIVSDVMARATPQPIACPSCLGVGLKRPDCPLCQGTGVSTSLPELDRQKLALELGHLTERKGGIVMQQNVQTTANAAALGSHAPGALEQFQQVVGDLLFAPRRRTPVASRGEPLAEAPEADSEASASVEDPV